MTDRHFRARIALLIQAPPNSQKVSNVVMGARSYGHRNENKLNAERLLILSAFANKGDISDRVVQKKQTELRFHQSNDELTMNEQVFYWYRV